MRFLAATLAALAVFATSTQALPTYSRTQAPKGWTVGERAPSSAPVSFTIALQQRNLDILNEKFEDVSTPGSPNYRKFMAAEDILNIVSPSKHDKNKVVAWLKSHGIHTKNIHDMGDALDITTTVNSAESLLRTFFHTYHSTTSSQKIVRTYGQYSVDRDIEPLIHMITGVSSFPVPHLRAIRSKATQFFSNGKVGAGSVDGIIAQSLESLYGIPSKLGLSTNTSQGVIEFQGQYFSSADLTAYGTDIGESLPSYPASQIIGTNNEASPQGESTLDVDMQVSVNQEASNWFWIEDGNGWMYQFSTHFFSTSDVPQVVSISYGWSESDQCSVDDCSSLGVTSQEYVERVNSEFQKIGLRGTTLIVSSGDSGCHGRSDDSCTAATAMPDWPGSSPYVLSVGATEIVQAEYNLANAPSICSSYNCVSGGYEQAVSYNVSQFASGGGFSNVAAQPSWQSSFVKSYLSSSVQFPPSSFFNSTSRGYPDVAAVGHNNLILMSGQVQPVGGTSAASPIWGAVVAFLNQAAIAKDGKPLGFINPLLYSIATSTPSAFHDITTGDNVCTEQGCASTCQGFQATTGWDPVTGLGSPNFPALLAAVQANL